MKHSLQTLPVLINTGALARWKDTRSTCEVFQHFPASCRKPFKSLSRRTCLLAAVLLALAVNSLAATHYVDLNCTNATPPYTDWTTAATNIQDAVDVALAGDEVVVTSGTYAGGVSINKPLTVRSVSGPQFTTISGGGPCVALASNASLSGFILTGGHSFGAGGGASGGTLNNCTLSSNSAGALGGDVYGGGASGCTLNNCTLSGNSASSTSDGFAYGGGASGCTLNNCTLSGNSAYNSSGNPFGSGGGAYSCTLNNCTLTGNSAPGGGGADLCTLNNCTLTGNSAYGLVECYPQVGCFYSSGIGGGADSCTLNNCSLTGNWASGYGGGVYSSTLNNCIVYFNTCTNGVNYDPSSTLNYCCTTPLPTNGVGNITNAPLLVDTNGWANLRLQSSSPCINAGNSACAPAGPDLDGNPRIVGGRVDIGAYEYQSLSLLNFSLVSNQAAFNITGQSKQVVTVEASADLLKWWPLSTNTLNGHPFPFSDPTPATLPQRFYRAQAQ
jgi:parallel beta-helix repeat protein